MRPFLIACMVLSVGFRAVGEPLSPEVLLLSRVKNKMRANLQRLPNYVCLETIERAHRNARDKKPQADDTVRLEIGYVDGREMFSWPGAAKFEESNIQKLVGGVIGNGEFAQFAHQIFVAERAQFAYGGLTDLEGRPAHRFTYRAPLPSAGYEIRNPQYGAMVGYRGEFLVDVQTEDVLRLRIEAMDIPAPLQLRSATNDLAYARVTIGAGDFLLPQGGQLSMVEVNGTERLNRTRFSNCRQYMGESVLRFDDVPETATPAAPTSVVLPTGLRLSLKLSESLDSRQLAVGDVVNAVVSRDSKQRGTVIVPKGAVVAGRVVQVELGQAPFGISLLRLELHEVRFGNAQAEIRATLEDLQESALISLDPRFSRGGRMRGRIVVPPPYNSFFVRGRSFTIPAGTWMDWRITNNEHDPL